MTTKENHLDCSLPEREVGRLKSRPADLEICSHMQLLWKRSGRSGGRVGGEFEGSPATIKEARCEVEWAAQRRCKWEGRVWKRPCVAGESRSLPFIARRPCGSLLRQSSFTCVRFCNYIIFFTSAPSLSSSLPPQPPLGKSGQRWCSLKLPPAAAERELDPHLECVFHRRSAGPNAFLWLAISWRVNYFFRFFSYYGGCVKQGHLKSDTSQTQ